MEINDPGNDDIKRLVDAVGRRIDAGRAAWCENPVNRFVAEKSSSHP
jgi:hypothetical protein